MIVLKTGSDIKLAVIAFLLFLGGLASNPISVQAQCAAPNFTLPANACRDQNVTLQPDAAYSSYEWDLCPGELTNTPVGSVLNSGYGGYGFKVKMIEQDGSYYGFFLGRANGRLFRLDFGSSINSTPTLNDLGGLGKNSTSWRAIEVVKEGSTYYGFIIDTNVLYRVSFGTSLTNPPSAPEVVLDGDPISSPIDMTLVSDNADKYLFIANLGNDKLVRVKFANSFNDAPATVQTDVIQVPGSILLCGISMIKDCNTWYGMTTSVATGNLYKLGFGNGLADPSPTIANYPIAPIAGVAVVKDNNQYLVFAQAQNATNSLFRLNFGSSLANTPSAPDDLNNFGVTGTGLWGFSMYKVKSDWLAITVENTGSSMFRITFPSNCLSSTTFSTAASPTIKTSTAGAFSVALEVTNGSGNKTSVSKPITVSSQISPDITFSTQNVCAAANVLFDSQTTASNVTYAWDFGDSGSSAVADPAHQFVAGTYTVTLNVQSTLTLCTNTQAQSIKIYPKPAASFTSPTGLICTSNNFTFNNQTNDVFDGLLQYQWQVNGSTVGTQRNLTFAFSTTGDQQVKLVTSIPGCSDETTQTVTGVLTGPVVDYTINGRCQGDPVTFTNQSTGSISGYSWNFGDGQASVNANSSNTYAAAGSYPVSLQATGTNGCNTTVTKNLVIYSKPQPNFTLDLPPFSCSGTPSQFHDATPTPNDSNIQGWSWNFGDSGLGAGKDPIHTYASAGDVVVRLTTTSDKGCVAFVDKTVTIAPSPKASFTMGPSCVNQATTFTDGSSGTIKSWQWKIGTAVYGLKNPSHVFLQSGSVAVQLTVTDQNNCASVTTGTVVVPVVPTVDFTAVNPCDDQPAIFSDASATASDPTVLRKWTINNNPVVTSDQTTWTFDAPGSYPVQLQIQNQSGCVYTLTKSVTINPTPTPAFTMSVDSGPPPLAVSFTNTSSGANTFRWSFNDGSAANTTTSPAHTFENLGQYVVDLTATSVLGCAATLSKTVNVVIPFNELGLADFSVVRPDNFGPYQGYVRVTNGSNYRVSGFYVTLEVGAGISLREFVNATLDPGATSLYKLTNEFNVPTSGYICAQLQDDENLANNKACVSMGGNVVLEPYPNPVVDFLELEVIQETTGVVDVTILTTSGAQAFRETLPVKAGLSHFTIDLAGLNPGLYIAVISTATGTTYKRLMVE